MFHICRIDHNFSKPLIIMNVVVKSLYFPFCQFRMLSSNSIDERASGNMTIVNLDEYNLSTSKLSYTREINMLEWCKVFDLSEYFI